MLNKIFQVVFCLCFPLIAISQSKNDNSKFEWDSKGNIYINKFNALDGFDTFSDNLVADNKLIYPKLYDLTLSTSKKENKKYYLEIKLANLIELQKKGGGEAIIVWGFKDWKNYSFIRLGCSEASNINYIDVGRIYKGKEELQLETGYLRFEKRGLESAFYGLSIDLEELKTTIHFNQGVSKANEYVIGNKINSICEVPITNDFIPNIGVTASDMSLKIDQVLCAFKEQSIINNSESEVQNKSKTGSGIVISTNGYIITNNHVVENGKKFEVNLNNKKYNATLVKVDKSNDLAILKIDDPTFINFSSIPFLIKPTLIPLGEKVFSLGFPMTQIQGTNVKLTEGSISSKTGYQDDPVCYQVSVPLQPGNSGGPLFDLNGYLVGIVNAGILDANSVGYAIKSNYLINFLDVVSELPKPNTKNLLIGKTFTQQVEILSKYCCLIKVE